MNACPKPSVSKIGVLNVGSLHVLNLFWTKKSIGILNIYIVLLLYRTVYIVKLEEKNKLQLFSGSDAAMFPEQNQTGKSVLILLTPRGVFWNVAETKYKIHSIDQLV